MKRREKLDESTHHDRWLVSYADFMTLLFALFVVLFASSYHDRDTIRMVSAAVKDGFQEMGAFSTSSKSIQAPGLAASKSNFGIDSTENGMAKMSTTPSVAGIDVAELHRRLEKALGKEIQRQEVDMRMTPEGFVISLHELGFFDSGEARLLPGAEDKIKRIASVLMDYGLDMRVEGHSDNMPIHNSEFSSNWDLSMARAKAVAMMLIDRAGFDPKRMGIAGYGEYHPTASNNTVEGRRANRRVDIVVVAASK